MRRPVDPEVEQDALIFGDPQAIRRRGKSRIGRIPKGPRDKKWRRYQPIWQRIEGEWKKHHCRKCRSCSFRILDQEGIVVHVRCVRNHKGTVLVGFVMQKPEE